jgi:glycosyltransferase involved in cell wall biosynthesis
MSGGFRFVSIVIPTLNCADALATCLDSIFSQEYPRESMEVIVSDGGSTDDTVKIALDRGCRVVENPLRTGEAGKARGIAEASGEIIALIDSDNILEGSDWLKVMTAPFDDPEIAGSEPIEFTYRKEDPPLTRYCALLGMNDPLCYFLGNYDRLSRLSGTWTGLEIKTREKEGYLEVELEPGFTPTMGANGFMVRKDLLYELEAGEYFFDIDVVPKLVELGHQRYAKVRTGIVHIYGSGLGTLTRKQLRRVRDWSYFRSQGQRSYPWDRQKTSGLVRFLLYCVLVLPLVSQAIKGYRRVPDPAWALHPPACLITLGVYGYGILTGLLRPKQQDRSRWRQ